MSLQQTRLVLFFTRGLSLRKWDQLGILLRELALYRALSPYLAEVALVTYGGPQERAYVDVLDGMRLVYNRWSLPGGWFRAWLVHGLSRRWRGRTVVKSNQVPGADIALAVARKWGLPFIARAGYLPSNVALVRWGQQDLRTREWMEAESYIFRHAFRVVVTTGDMKRTVAERYGVAPHRIHVVPNYVDTQRFRPGPGTPKGNVVLYVGRLEPEKNLACLLEAMTGLPGELWLVGRGRQEAELRRRAAELHLPVRFFGAVPHPDLPELYRRATVVVLPSLVEHHPKVLLEAMACGRPVVGTRVTGIRDLIRDGETGLLCEPTVDGLRAALVRLLEDAGLRARLGQCARAFVVRNFGLERVVQMELEVLREVVDAFAWG